MIEAALEAYHTEIENSAEQDADDSASNFFNPVAMAAKQASEVTGVKEGLMYVDAEYISKFTQ